MGRAEDRARARAMARSARKQPGLPGTSRARARTARLLQAVAEAEVDVAPTRFQLPPTPKGPGQGGEARDPAGGARRPDPGRVALGNLRNAVGRREAAEKSVTSNVVAARRAGRTWREIGAVLGVTTEGARKRYGSAVDKGQPPLTARTTPA